MKILHLVANWKWTGPAEPAVNLAAELSRRGHDVKLLVGRARGDEAPLRREASRRGLEPDESLCLGKHRNPFRDVPDKARLVRLIRASRFDVAHAHLGNDHRILAAARRSAGANLPIVRSWYDGELPDSRAERRLLASDAEAITTPSERVASLLPGVLGIPSARVVRIETAIDLARFTRAGPDLRERLAIPRGAVVVGVVARMQRHRRFEVLLEAFARAAREVSSLHFLLVGRGTWKRSVAEDPVRRLGLADRTSFPGYLSGEDYPAALRTMDALVYLVPGSDGSCRTVREALAAGVPVIASRAGMLPEIVDDGRVGVHVDVTSESIAAAIVRLARDPALRSSLSAAAAAHAALSYSLSSQAEAVERLYEGLAVAGGVASR